MKAGGKPNSGADLVYHTPSKTKVRKILEKFRNKLEYRTIKELVHRSGKIWRINPVGRMPTFSLGELTQLSLFFIRLFCK